MDALIAIPARYGSTRFPGKPLVQIAGMTLIERVWRRAITSAHADAIWIATDDTRIEAHALSFGANVVRTGEAETGTDRIAAALPHIEAVEGKRFEIIVNLQGDEPLVDVPAVDRVIEALRTTDADIVTLCAPIGSEEEFLSPDIVKVVSALDSSALYFSRSPIPHSGAAGAMRHVGLYGYRAEALIRFTRLAPTPLERTERLEQLRALQNGFRIHLLQTTAPGIGVDRPEDVSRIESELAR